MAATHVVDDGRREQLPSLENQTEHTLNEISTRAADMFVKEFQAQTVSLDKLQARTALSAEISLIVEDVGHILKSLFAFSAEPRRVAVMKRAVKGLEAAINTHLNNFEEARVLSASTDVGALARALTAAASDPSVSKLDPTAELIAAGAELKTELIKMAGGLFGLQEASSILKITRQAVEKRRKIGGIIAVQTGDDFRYPACQFTQNGMVEGLDKVLKAMPIRSDWMRLEWLLTPDDALECTSPLEALKAGRLDDVMQLARAHGAE